MDNVLKKKPVNMEDMLAYNRILSNLGIVNEGVCSTAADTAAKTLTLGATFKLENKATILVKFTNGISVANSTLAITHTTFAGTEITEIAKPIYLNGAALEADIVPAGATVILRYNGTLFDIIGSAGNSDIYSQGEGIIINNKVISVDSTVPRFGQDGTQESLLVPDLVNDVAFDSTNNKFTVKKNNISSDIVTLATLKQAMSLNNVENKSSATIRGELTSSDVTSALGFTPVNSSDVGAASGIAELDENGKVPSGLLPSMDYVPNSEKGAASGVATLDNSGKVPSSQLPSYVDDIIEGYYHGVEDPDTHEITYNFYSNSLYTELITPETGKIYVDLATNLTYRWSGSLYIVMSSPYVLPNASANVLGGIKVGTNLSIDSNGVLSATDTTYSVATQSADGLLSSTDKTKLDGILAGALAHIAPTTAEVKSALGTGSGTSKYLREDGLWVTPPDNNTTYSAGTGLSLSGTTFSVKTGYTTSGKNYKVEADTNGNLYVNVPWSDNNTTYSGSSTVTLSGTTFSLTKANVTTALGYTPPTSDTNTWRPLGTGANDACAGNDSRLSNSRPASDVYSWAKAASKPSYSIGEISGIKFLSGTMTVHSDGSHSLAYLPMTVANAEKVLSFQFWTSNDVTGDYAWRYFASGYRNDIASMPVGYVNKTVSAYGANVSNSWVIMMYGCSNPGTVYYKIITT